MRTVKKATVKNISAGPSKKTPVAGPVDAKGQYTKVQERTLGNMKTGGTLSPTKQNVGKTIGKLNKAKDGKWIQKAIKKPGALRSSLGVKKGESIPASKLAAAAKKPGKMGQRARLAQTLKKMKKK
jgi:hypothetical protein